MRHFLIISVMALVACERDRPAPPLVVTPPVIEDAGAPPLIIDAGPPQEPTSETSAGDEEEPPGLADDSPMKTPSLEGEGLKELIVRDPAQAAKSLSELGTPEAWQVALHAQLALRLGEPGPDVIPESSLPDVWPTEHRLEAVSDAGITRAYVAAAMLPLKASGKTNAPTVMQLPINTPVSVLKLDGDLAAISVEVATDVQFRRVGTQPSGLTTIAKTGVVDARLLVTAPVDAAALATLAATKKGSEYKEDEAVVLRHRLFVLERNEATRKALIDAAWAANRASWVVSAAMSQLHVAPKRLDVAWACLGDPPHAKWLSLSNGKVPAKLPESVCLSHVDLRKPCGGNALAAWETRSEALDRAGVRQNALVQMTIDASKPRALWFYTVALREHEVCGGESQFELDPYRIQVRRLVLPIGTSKTTVRVESPAYDGAEIGVIAAPNEEKARSWLRKRIKYRFTYDAQAGELVLSLGVQDTHFESERDVTVVNTARPPERDCQSGCSPEEG